MNEFCYKTEIYFKVIDALQNFYSHSQCNPKVNTFFVILQIKKNVTINFDNSTI